MFKDEVGRVGELVVQMTEGPGRAIAVGHVRFIGPSAEILDPDCSVRVEKYLVNQLIDLLKLAKQQIEDEAVEED